MDGYQAQADAYKRLLETDKTIDRGFTERKINALEIMAEADQLTQYELFNTGAFNDIVKGYAKMALDGTELESEERRAVLRELNYLFDTVTADQAERYHLNH